MSDVNNTPRRYCTSCGAENRAGNRFCKECGNPLVVEPQDTQDAKEQVGAPQPSSTGSSSSRSSPLVAFLRWLYSLWKRPLTGWRRAVRGGAILALIYFVLAFLSNLLTSGIGGALWVLPVLLTAAAFIFLFVFTIAYMALEQANTARAFKAVFGLPIRAYREVRTSSPKVALAVVVGLGGLIAIVLLVVVISALTTDYEVILERDVTGEIRRNATRTILYTYNFTEVQVDNREGIQQFEESLDYDGQYLPADNDFDCEAVDYYSSATGQLLRSSLYTTDELSSCEYFLRAYEVEYGPLGG